MDYTTVPIGFGNALAENETAVNAYAMMTKDEKNAILEKAHKAKNMQQIVSAIAADSIL